MSDNQPDLDDVVRALAMLSLRGHRSSSLEEIAQELDMAAPYAEALQGLLAAGERDERIRPVVHDAAGEPRYTLIEDDERHNTE
jgi:hypothetical protein